jgi:hypothetical protein
MNLTCWNKNIIYEGMVNEKNLPDGFGRATCEKGTFFIDGQFKNGQLHGYMRIIK